jgi:hypothetical protein
VKVTAAEKFLPTVTNAVNNNSYSCYAAFPIFRKLVAALVGHSGSNIDGGGAAARWIDRCSPSSEKSPSSPRLDMSPQVKHPSTANVCGLLRNFKWAEEGKGNEKKGRGRRRRGKFKVFAEIDMHQSTSPSPLRDVTPYIYEVGFSSQVVKALSRGVGKARPS